MKIIVDKEAEAIYIYMDSKNIGKGGIVKNTVTVDQNVNIDYGENEKIIGIEILSLNVVDLEQLKKIEYFE